MPRCLGLVAMLPVLALAAASAFRATAPAAAVRVDQLGFALEEAKVAYLLTAVPHPGAAFTVVDSGGNVA